MAPVVRNYDNHLLTMMRCTAQLVASNRHAERDRAKGDDCADEKQVHDLSPDEFIGLAIKTRQRPVNAVPRDSRDLSKKSKSRANGSQKSSVSRGQCRSARRLVRQDRDYRNAGASRLRERDRVRHAPEHGSLELDRIALEAALAPQPGLAVALLP